MAFSLSDMVRFGTNLGQLLNTHPLLLKLGSWSSLSLQHTVYDEVAMLEYDESYLRAAREAGATFFKCGDWRCAPWSLQFWRPLRRGTRSWCHHSSFGTSQP